MPRVSELVEVRDCEQLYVPPVAPNPNPVAQVFNKVKALLREVGKLTGKALLGGMAGRSGRGVPITGGAGCGLLQVVRTRPITGELAV